MHGYSLNQGWSIDRRPDAICAPSMVLYMSLMIYMCQFLVNREIAMSVFRQWQITISSIIIKSLVAVQRFTLYISSLIRQNMRPIAIVAGTSN